MLLVLYFVRDSCLMVGISVLLLVFSVGILWYGRSGLLCDDWSGLFCDMVGLLCWSVIFCPLKDGYYIKLKVKHCTNT